MRQVRSRLALTVGLLVLTGCTDGGAQADPEPIIPSSSSAEPSPDEPTPDEPTESPTEEPPEMLAAASERSYAGAEAFVRHWVELFNHAQLTGETAPMENVSDPECVSCGGIVEVVDEVYGNGGSVQSRGWIIRQVGSDGITPLSMPTLSSSVRQSRETITYEGSDRVERSDPSVFNVLFQLRRDGADWRMRELEVLD